MLSRSLRRVSEKQKYMYMDIVQHFQDELPKLASYDPSATGQVINHLEGLPTPFQLYHENGGEHNISL